MKTGRPIEIQITLSGEQRQELRRLAREAVGRISERAHFVLLSDQGKRVPEIGALMGYSAQAVYPWLERYQQQGIAGLYDEPCHLAGDNGSSSLLMKRRSCCIG
jgi:hypothetical protein